MHLFLLFYSTSIVPLFLAAPVNPTNQGETSKSSSQDPEKIGNCYFSQVRKHVLEKHDRPIKSVVSTTCSGAEEKLGNRHLDKTTDEEDSLSLLLCRGAGLCDLDFSNQAVLNQWNDVTICDHHLDELLIKWGNHHGGFRGKHMYRRRTSHGRQYACSMPSTVGEDHHQYRPIHGLHRLTIAESKAILNDQNILVHPGIPICSIHKTFVQGLVAAQSTPPPKKLKIDYSECDDTIESAFDRPYVPPGTKAESTKRTFLNFANAAGVPRTCSIIPWDQMKITTKERKASAARRLIDTMLILMVPDQTEDFQKLVEKRFIQMDSWTTGSSEKLDIIMSQIAAQYFVDEDRNTRILILSLIANSVPFASVEKYIPGLTNYMYNKAKKFARRKRETVLNNHAAVERYNKEAVDAFIEFITSPIVLIGLPYGTRKVKMEDGDKIEIPNSIRQQSATEIIEMYTKILEENDQNDLKLGVSTMYKILTVCAATKRESTQCVDYFIAMGMESFDRLHSILDGWKDLGLLEFDTVKQMKTELYQAAQYLRTDYRLHVKQTSRVADHCAVYALSDPYNSALAESCSIGPDAHTHNVKCDRCERTKAILDIIEEHARVFVDEKEKDAAHPDADDADKLFFSKHKEELELIEKYKKNIFEMKKHLLRAAVTNDERNTIVGDLLSGEALITLDFAQKYLPKWHREKQSDYFGKKGISYHISHVTARMEKDTFEQHSFVHVYDGSVTQDSRLVVVTIAHFLKELKNVGINKVFLRSDNAGAYHSALTIGSLYWLEEETGMTIGSYTFSESQNGKSSSDRDANRVKRRVMEYVNKGNDVITSDQFFEALKHNPPNGVSIHHGSVTNTAEGSTEWKGISNLNYFKVEKTGIRAHRYNKIGDGVFVEKSSLKPVMGTYEFEEAGFLASQTTTAEDEQNEIINLLNGNPTPFWYQSKCSETSSCVVEADVISPTIEEHVPDSTIGDLYACPHPGCSSTFLKFYNLEKHLLRGKHNLSPEKMSLRDHALNLFVKNLEDASNTERCPIVANAIKEMKESTLDTDLKMGWALPEKRTRKPFGQNVVSFLVKCYNQGERNKRPLNPVKVAEMMRTELNDDGSKRFAADEYKDPRQIASFFSREADKRRKEKSDSSPSSSTKAPQSTLRRKRQDPEETDEAMEDFEESEDEHPDAGWIRFLRMEEFWSSSDEFLDAVLTNKNDIFTNNECEGE
ncbi:unnamed protein product [Caenorhabditis nigoni]